MNIREKETAARSVGADGQPCVSPDTKQNQLGVSIPPVLFKGKKILVPELSSVDGETLLSLPLEPIRFVVDGLLAQGAYLLAGAPKKGKSWMALQLCLAVSTGVPLWNLNVTQGDALYLCLEDNINRIQSRLLDFADDAPPSIHFVTLSAGIGKGLEEQIELFVLRYAQTRLVVIDTLQKVRAASGDNAYANDYDDVGAVKSLADHLGLCVLLVHHTRKQYDSDPMNMISGTTGMPAAADGYLVLQSSKDEPDCATLYCSGRDIENRELKLKFDKQSHHWEFVADSITQPELFMENLFSVLCECLREHGAYSGSPTGLANLLQGYTEEKISPGKLSKKLLQSSTQLASLGIRYVSRRSSGKRIVELSWNGDGSAVSDGT